MTHFFKRFCKEHDHIAALFPTGPPGKASVVEETSKQCLTEKDNAGTRISDDDGLLQVGFASSSSEDKPVLTGHPKEPCEIDHPMRCPHLEPCIMQDGRVLKKKPSGIRRRGQLPFLTKTEVHKLRRSGRSAPSDFRAASEPS